MRKVIQISSVAAPCEPTAHDAFCEVFALCDDGAVFNGFWKVGAFEWKQLPPIPQSEISADDVVMPVSGETIFIRHKSLSESRLIEFNKISDVYIYGYEVSLLNLVHGDLWRRRNIDPWRDATGKVVEV